MAKQNLASVAGTSVGAKLLGKARFSWIGYGILAYAGLRLLRRYNLLAPYPEKILGAVDGFVGQAVGQVTSRVSAMSSSIGSKAEPTTQVTH